MMRKKPVQHHMEGLLVLLLFGVFAACVLSVLLMGAGRYRVLTERDDASYSWRTAAQYLTTRVRQADTADGVRVGAFDGGEGEDTLFLTEQIDGVAYTTRVYWYDGSLRELFAEEGTELDKDAGETVLDCGGVRFFETDSGVSAELTGADGEITRLDWTLRSGKGAAS
ncbi:MAG: DUF4860 domain-containing protein [Dysosmobacter sp.]|jgi:hypothetical protein|uniref:DUF4860 domain-containing protein n=1 Tax=Dysosmobacter sp. TaxID=2591382 RepID=UPI003D8AECF7